MTRAILSFWGLLVLAACNGGGPNLAVPPLAPIVRAATPAALALPQVVARSLLRRIAESLEGQAYADGAPPDRSTIEGALRIVFSGSGVAGQPPEQGFIIGSILDVDARKAGFDTTAKDNKTSCLDRAPGTLWLASLQPSLPAPAAGFTLQDMRCRSHFGGDSAAGMVFGATITNDVVADYSIWLTPQQQGSAVRFGYLVNVADPEGGDPRVDFLYLENSPALGGRVMMYRFKARPSTLDPNAGVVVKSFQITMASSAGGVESLECGFRMISDGTLIWAEGRHLAIGSDCAQATTFAKCYSASDMAARDASACAGMKTFDADMALVDGPSLATAGPAFADLLDLGHATGSVDDF